MDAAGAVTLLAGSGAPGFQDGLGAAASFDDPRGLAADPLGGLFVADLNNHRVRHVALDGSVVTIEPADGGERVSAMVGSGFFSVAGDEVAILAEQAEIGEEIDVQHARQALEDALSAGGEDATPERRARARLRAAGIEV